MSHEPKHIVAKMVSGADFNFYLDCAGHETLGRFVRRNPAYEDLELVMSVRSQNITGHFVKRRLARWNRAGDLEYWTVWEQVRELPPGSLCNLKRKK